VQPCGEPFPRRGEDPRPLAEIADHLFPDRSDQIDPKSVPLDEVDGVEPEWCNRPYLVEGEARLDELQAQVDRLKKHQVRTAEELDALLSAVLDRAFWGQL